MTILDNILIFFTMTALRSSVNQHHLKCVYTMPCLLWNIYTKVWCESIIDHMLRFHKNNFRFALTQSPCDFLSVLSVLDGTRINNLQGPPAYPNPPSLLSLCLLRNFHCNVGWPLRSDISLFIWKPAWFRCTLNKYKRGKKRSILCLIQQGPTWPWESSACITY